MSQYWHDICHRDDISHFRKESVLANARMPETFYEMVRKNLPEEKEPGPQVDEGQFPIGPF